VEPWKLVETEFHVEDQGTTETIFAVGNGYLGMRGNAEEGRPAFMDGTFVNGFHETWPIQHAEEAFGFAKTGQTRVNAPDMKVVRLFVDDEPLRLDSSDVYDYRRTLDFRTGRLTRHLVWRTASGKRVEVSSSRLVSLVHRHLGLITFDVRMLEGAGPVTISSELRSRPSSSTGKRSTRPRYAIPP
jgi:alpha,alpha-trehalose phosphorylase